MAWRTPRYGLLHAARLAGVSALSAANTFSTTEPEDHLIDDRAGSLCTFTGTANDHYIQIDRGAGTLEEINRFWIPSGHNFSTWDVRLRSATDSGITTSVSLLVDPAGDGLSVGSGALDFEFSDDTQRYVRLDWPNETGINPELGELVLTNTRTTTRGPEPAWQDEETPNVEVLGLRSGAEAILVLGADRRRMAFTYRDVTASADLTFWDDLIAVGPSHPILVDPAFDDEPVHWMRLVGGVRRRQDPQLPAVTDQKKPEIRIELLEHLA